MGLYGVEATPINCSSLRKLPGRTTDAMVGKHQSMRSPEVALAILGKAGIAVKANILWRQARLMRRAWHHRPEWRGLMTRVWQRIASMFTGQRHPEEDESDGADLAAPAGLVRMAGRRGANLLKKGPCGLLLSSVMRAGGSLTEDGNMLFPGRDHGQLPQGPRPVDQASTHRQWHCCRHEEGRRAQALFPPQGKD